MRYRPPAAANARSRLGGGRGAQAFPALNAALRQPCRPAHRAAAWRSLADATLALHGAAKAHAAAACAQQALDACEDKLALYGACNAAERAHVRVLRARSRVAAGDWSEGGAEAAEVLEQFSPPLLPPLVTPPAASRVCAAAARVAAEARLVAAQWAAEAAPAGTAAGTEAGMAAAHAEAAAEAALQRAAQLDPQDAWAVAQLGALALRRGDALAALPLLERAAAAQPGAAPTHLLLARACWLAGGADRARCFKHALEAAKLDPSCADAFELLGRCYAGVMGDQERARRCLARAVELQPAMAEAGERLVRLYEASGQHALLRAAVEGAAQRSLRAGWAWAALARLQVQAEEAAAAITSFQHALRVTPRSVALWEGLAQAYAAEGRFTAAAKSLAHVLELCPGRASALQQLGQVQCALGQFPEAQASLREALCVAPGYLLAQHALAEALLAAARMDIGALRFARAAEQLREGAALVAACTRARGDLACLWKLWGDLCTEAARLPPLALAGVARGAAFGTAVHGAAATETAAGAAAGERVQQLADAWQMLLEFVQEGERAYARALDLRPDDCAAALDLAANLRVQALLLRRRAGAGAGFLPLAAARQAGRALLDRAAAVALRGLRRDPLDSALWAAVGVCAEHPLRQQHALVRAIRLDNNAEAWNNLGMLYLEMRQADLARLALVSSQCLNPSNANLWIGHGLISEIRAQHAMLQAGLTPAQLRAAGAAATATPARPVHARGLASQLAALRQQACAAYLVARDLLGPPADAYLGHGAAALAQGAVADACVSLTQFRAAEPSHPVGAFLLGVALSRAGRARDAVLALEEAEALLLHARGEWLALVTPGEAWVAEAERAAHVALARLRVRLAECRLRAGVAAASAAPALPAPPEGEGAAVALQALRAAEAEGQLLQAVAAARGGSSASPDAWQRAHDLVAALRAGPAAPVAAAAEHARLAAALAAAQVSCAAAAASDAEAGRSAATPTAAALAAAALGGTLGGGQLVDRALALRGAALLELSAAGPTPRARRLLCKLMHSAPSALHAAALARLLAAEPLPPQHAPTAAVLRAAEAMTRAARAMLLHAPEDLDAGAGDTTQRALLLWLCGRAPCPDPRLAVELTAARVAWAAAAGLPATSGLPSDASSPRPAAADADDTAASVVAGVAAAGAAAGAQPETVAEQEVEGETESDAEGEGVDNDNARAAPVALRAVTEQSRRAPPAPAARPDAAAAAQFAAAKALRADPSSAAAWVQLCMAKQLRLARARDPARARACVRLLQGQLSEARGAAESLMLQGAACALLVRAAGAAGAAADAAVAASAAEAAKAVAIGAAAPMPDVAMAAVAEWARGRSALWSALRSGAAGDEAQAAALRAIRLLPNWTAGWRLWADALAARGLWASAAMVLRSAADAMHDGRGGGAQAGAAALRRAALLVHQCLALRRSGQGGAACAAADAACRLLPQCVPLQLFRAALQLEQRRDGATRRKAASAAEQALRNSPGSLLARHVLLRATGEDMDD